MSEVKFKRIIDNFNDAPFIAALIIAPSCSRGCVGCQNQHIQDEEDILDDPRATGEAIRDNPFWDGIILGGLEPLDDMENFKQLMEVVRFSEVAKLMIYTSYELYDVPLNIVPRNVRSLYIKTGKYIQDSETVTYSLRSWELELASDNQTLHLLQRNSVDEWIAAPVIKCRKNNSTKS